MPYPEFPATPLNEDQRRIIQHSEESRQAAIRAQHRATVEHNQRVWCVEAATKLFHPEIDTADQFIDYLRIIHDFVSGKEIARPGKEAGESVRTVSD